MVRLLLLVILTSGLNLPLSGQMPVNRFRPDSTLSDSTRNLEDITRLTLFFNPASLRQYGLRPADSFRLEPSALRFWDEADTLSGWVQTLGNMGKPVRRVRYGLTDALFTPAEAGDPFTAQQDPYFLYDYSRLKYADTRTPFVNVNFAQASKRLQRVDVTISQNVTPWWNALIHYGRKVSDGSFFNTPTDHYSIYTTQSFRTRNGKYLLNLAAVFQQLRDGINGGISLVQASALEISPLNATPEISRSNFLRSGKSLYLHQVYKMYHDSTKVEFKPYVFMEAGRNGYFRQYEDRSFQLGNSVYPAIWRDSTSMNEAWKIRQTSLLTGIGLNWKSINQEVTYSWKEYPVYTRYLDSLYFQIRDWKYQGSWRSERQQASVNWKLLRRETTGLPAAHYGEMSWLIPIPVWGTSGKGDTLLMPNQEIRTENWKPLRWLGAVQGGQVNPPMMELLYRGNTFQASGNRNNQDVLHARTGIEWRNADRLVSGRERKKGNYFRVTGFYTHVSQFVGYQPNLTRIDDGAGNQWTRSGLEAAFRFRLGRLYLEPEVVWQPGATASAGMIYYALDQPEVYGRSSLYYENQLFRKAGLFRFGADISAFNAYSGMAYEPGSGLFIPSGTMFLSYRIPEYIRADLFMTAQVRRAVIFLRLLHVNQGMWYPQYYTTPYYPAWGRVFSFGVNWTFYD